MNKKNIILFSIATTLLLANCLEGMDKKEKEIEIIFTNYHKKKNLQILKKNSDRPFTLRCRFDGKNKISAEDFNKILQINPNIKYLAILINIDWDDIHIEKIRGLERLCLTDTNITKKQLNTIKNANPGIKSLSLDFCKSDFSLKFKDLEGLYLCRSNITKKSLYNFLSFNSNIKALTLSKCNNIVWGEITNFPALKNLKDLQIRGTYENSSLIPEINRVTEKTLNLIFNANPQINSVTLDKSFFSSRKKIDFDKLPDLTALHLEGITMTVESWNSIFENHPKLTYLALILSPIPENTKLHKLTSLKNCLIKGKTVATSAQRKIIRESNKKLSNILSLVNDY